MSSIEELRKDPAYSEGFWDASDDLPLCDDASEAYEAGWRAWYRVKGIFLDAGFAENPDGSFTKSFTTREPRS